MAAFVQSTFVSGKGKKKEKRGKKDKKVNNELRLKEKVPEEEIIKKNIERLREYKAKNKVKDTVLNAILREK
jgi:hypothetical protein